MNDLYLYIVIGVVALVLLTLLIIKIIKYIISDLYIIFLK